MGGIMLEDLQYLLQLQEIDLRIKEQELAQENFPALVNELKEQVSKAEASFAAIKEKMLKAETEMNNWEEQVQKAHAGLEKSQERLNSIKTNREYDAVHAEIEAQKNIINGAEQRRKNIAADIDKLQAAVSEQQTALEAVTAENTPKIQELQEKIAAIDSTIATITKERDAVLPSIGKHILRQYELIKSKRKTGRVISNISSTRTCAVCHKVLERQLFSEIKRGVKLIFCQSCGSIMVWQSADGSAE